LGLLAAITALAFCALHMVMPVLPLLAGCSKTAHRVCNSS
jgi:hypothetical protein